MTGNPMPLPCIFSDVEGCIPAGTYQADMSFAWKLYFVSSSPFQRYQMCRTHNCMCSQFPAVSADLDVSGLPCPDFSRAGARHYEQGITNTVFMCHAKRHIELQTPLIIIENVEDRVCFLVGFSCSALQPKVRHT